MILRCFVPALVALFLTVPAFAQSARKLLISADKNLNVGADHIHGKDVTPECEIPWSIQLSTLHGGKQEGVQLLTLDNGKMQIVVIPTRGMGVLSVTMGDLKLGWKSPVTEIVHPQHQPATARRARWLEGFKRMVRPLRPRKHRSGRPDEIVNNVGDKATVELTLHGKIANIPASEVEVSVQDRPPYRITVRGIMQEKMLFGPKFELSPRFPRNRAPRNFASKTKSSTAARNRRNTCGPLPLQFRQAAPGRRSEAARSRPARDAVQRQCRPSNT